MIRLVVPVLMIVGMSAAVAEETDGEMLNHVVCKKGSDSRELEITSKGTGHVTVYTHGGKSSEVANCSMSPAKCSKVFDQIKTKLESTGFTCET